MAFVKRVEIRWRDLDGFLHVNNAVYLTYLEETRENLDDYLELIRDRSRELFGLDDPAGGSDPDSDRRQVATVEGDAHAIRPAVTRGRPSDDGAQEKTRTSTTLRPQVPETCASTNSATWASEGRDIGEALRKVNGFSG